MKTEDNIQKEVINLIRNIPFNDINVNLICNNLNITRQAFYYHYENIFDVIYAIYLSNPIKNDYKDSINETLNDLIDYLNMYKSFHKLIYKSDAKEILLDIFTSYINKFLLRYLDKFKFNENVKKSISRVYSYGISTELLFLFFSLENSEEVLKRINLIFNDNVILQIKKE